MSAKQGFIAFSIISILIIATASLFWPGILWLLLIIIPTIIVGIIDIIQTKSTLRRIYPIVAHIRYFLESFRPEIQQYFIESDTNGQPVSREFRSLVYQRAKGVRDTRPFGTIFDVYSDNYEWISHSIAPCKLDHAERVHFGDSDCTQPYEASPLNISAMSYGSLSKTAIESLNKGAKMGDFYHNTGEGGISPYHLKHGGDLVWQIGTGYFGCRDLEGNFDEELFIKNATRPEVKMIEIKLSQGAKPGHGGILPAVKVNQEVSEIRNVEIGKAVISPSSHTAFNTPLQLIDFVSRLRKLSGGKPVGFKLCIGKRHEFLSICKAMHQLNKYPDFITVDGAEGGTGAAPIELANSVGMPLREGVNFVDNALRGIGARDKIRIIASGKIISAFHMLRIIALGADCVNSGRGMMFALGCIQARSCNTDKCPTGITTQNPARYQMLDITNKSERVANYHKAMIKHLMELMEAANIPSLSEAKPKHINRRVAGTEIRDYSELYETLKEGSLINGDDVPSRWNKFWLSANPQQWGSY